MSAAPTPRSPAWAQLDAHHQKLAGRDLRTLFAEEPERGVQLRAQATGIYMDFAKQRLTPETISLLCALARERGLRERIDAMFAGERINVSEDRPVLHVALRAPREASIVVDGVDVVKLVHEVLARCAALAHAVRSGSWRGHTGRPIRNVVNIGIGGSDLGPAMSYEALRDFSDRDITVRFVANVDGSDLVEATRDLDAAETLFVVCSKSWHTEETLVNAMAARRWAMDGLGGDQEAVARHFVAVSTNADAVREFGIDLENMFPIWDWVGGRYSYDSAIGLSLMIAVGPQRFGEMLGGSHEIDEHFRTAPFEQNLPVLMGLIAVWCVNFLAADTLAVLPYSRRLARFPAYLQQLQMESNGKHVTREGRPVSHDTGQIVWGEPGTGGQHAFYQLLHQGTRLVPCDFIGFTEPLSSLEDQHDLLMANMFAQAEALAFGRSEQELRAEGSPEAQIPHRVCLGNRPSTTIMLERLDPAALGRLVALYEHSVFTQGVIWGIDSFDQWGVELGKLLAKRISPQLTGESAPGRSHDSSTAALIAHYRQARGRAV
ncbi:MAG: glucose-6-phosphate isomerase [Solirubrobacteraceae bacterium]